jgi:hypothetical protein
MPDAQLRLIRLLARRIARDRQQPKKAPVVPLRP